MQDIDLKTKNKCLLNEISIASDKTKSRLTEIHELKCKTNDLMQTVLKFTNGKKNLDMLLSSQRISFYKIGLGYNVLSKPPLQKKIVAFVTSLHDHSHTSFSSHAPNDCTYDMNSRSNIMYSSIVKSFSRKPKSKWIWVPKTNPNGHKQPWVPRDSFV